MKRWSRGYLQKAFKGKQVGAASARGPACRAWLRGGVLAAPRASAGSGGRLPSAAQPFLWDTCTRLPPCQVIVGDQPISFDAYCRYSDQNNDELPLYL